MYGLIISLDTAEARISEPKDISLGISKTEKQKEKVTGEGARTGGGDTGTDFIQELWETIKAVTKESLEY